MTLGLGTLLAGALLLYAGLRNVSVTRLLVGDNGGSGSDAAGSSPAPSSKKAASK